MFYKEFIMKTTKMKLNVEEIIAVKRDVEIEVEVDEDGEPVFADYLKKASEVQKRVLNHEMNWDLTKDKVCHFKELKDVDNYWAYGTLDSYEILNENDVDVAEQLYYYNEDDWEVENG